jgi:hypothetical protein
MFLSFDLLGESTSFILQNKSFKSKIKMELTNRTILLIAIIVIIFLLVVLYFCFRPNPRLEHLRQKEERLKRLTEEQEEESKEVKIEKKEERIEVSNVRKEEVKNENCVISDVPVLKCYDYFQLPDAGSYTVKTCGINKGKLFIQWFPVSGATEYNIYANQGKRVSTGNYIKKWTVPNTSNYLETEEIAGECWSALVTSVNDCGESLPSKIFTTCN